MVGKVTGSCISIKLLHLNGKEAVYLLNVCAWEVGGRGWQSLQGEKKGWGYDLSSA